MSVQERRRGLGVHPVLIALGLAVVATLMFALPLGGAQGTFGDLYVCSTNDHTSGIPSGRNGLSDAHSTEPGSETLPASSGVQSGATGGICLDADHVFSIPTGSSATIQPTPHTSPDLDRHLESDSEPGWEPAPEESAEEHREGAGGSGEMQRVGNDPAADQERQQGEQDSDASQTGSGSDRAPTAEQGDSTADESPEPEQFAVGGEQEEPEGDASDVSEQQSEPEDTEDSGEDADVELETEGAAANAGTGIERTDQVLVQSSPGTGSGGSTSETESRDGRVTWAIIILLIAVVVIALDWARRRSDSSE